MVVAILELGITTMTTELSGWKEMTADKERPQNERL
jgi:hypothetical protein